MANIRYNVPCPSCEAEVPIRSTALIGKKTECPKCKYRFTVPEPPEDAAGGEDEAPKKEKKGKKKPAKKGGSGMLIGVVVGVLVLGGLGAAGFFIFGGDDSPKPSASSAAAPSRPTPNIAAATGDGATTPTEGGKGEGGKGEGEKGGTEPPAATTGEGEKKPDEGGEKKADKPKATSGESKDITNLLPGDTRAVYRVNFDRLKQSATPLYTSVFDNYVQGLFQTSLTVPFDELETYIHCVVDPDREPFGVVRTKGTIDRTRLYAATNLEKPASGGKVKTYEYFLLKSNPFVDAVSKAFTLKGVIGVAGLGKILPLPDPPAPDPKAPVKRYALCVYDDNTLFVGAEGLVERFLTELQDNGYPPYKSELTPAEAPTDPSATPPAGEGSPGAPGPVGGGATAGPGGPRAPEVSDSGRDVQNRGGQKPGGANPELRGEGDGPPGAPPGAPGGRKVARKLFTSVPTYRTVEPDLKRLLNQLEEDEKKPPAVLYAERIDQQLISARVALEVFRLTNNPIAGLAGRVRMLGGVLSQFDKDRGDGRLAMEFVSDDEARRAINENIRPILDAAKADIDPAMGTTTTINGGGQQGGGGPGFPGGSGDGAEGGPTEGGGGRGSPGGRGYGGPPPGSTGPPPGFGGSGGPPPGFGGSGSQPPGGGMPREFEDGKGTVNIAQADTVVTVTGTLNWPEDKFSGTLMPKLARTGGQVRGRIAVQSGEADWHSLAAAAVKLGKEKKPFPRGTMERELKEERYRLPFPPEQRVSFLAELLPYLGRAGLRQQIQEKKGPWWSKENLPAAETWVPEFLVPYYPQESWRVDHPRTDGRPLGGTNYVAPAGLGLDAGRYDPSKPEFAKKVGITGYDWGSKPEDVTDGLSNTIYLIQVPPDYRQAWIAGGGSTVRGVDDKAADPLDDFAHKAPDGRRGTYALMADGSVRWLPKGVKPEVFKGLVTRAGGEALGDLDKIAPQDKSKRSETELKGGAAPPKSGDASSTPAAGQVNADELKKFQGRWKVTKIKDKQLKAMAPPGVDMLSVITIELVFEGTTMKLKFSGDKVPPQVAAMVPPQTISRLDPSASPKVMVAGAKMQGKEVSAESVYEFTSGDKLIFRAAAPGQPRPKSVAEPDDDSRDTFMVLERVKD